MELFIMLAAAAAVIAAYVAIVYNRIVGGTNLAKRAWANVISWQRKELRALEMMADKMREYAAFEKSTLQDVTRLRESVQRLDGDTIDVAALRESSDIARGIVAKLDARREAYPELKTDKLYLGYMKEVSESEAQIAASVTVYNNTVESFNNLIQFFPNNILNAAFFHRAPIKEFTDSRSSKEFDYSPNF